jgi:hypothetical protein
MMRTPLEGTFATEIYTTDDGLLAIEQANNIVVLSADEIVVVIEKLRAYYDSRAQWQEATPE